MKIRIDSRYNIISSLFWRALAALKRRENYKNVSKSKWLLFYIFIGRFHWRFSVRKIHYCLTEFAPQRPCHMVHMTLTHRHLNVTIFIEIKRFFFLYSIYPSAAVDTTTSVSTGTHEIICHFNMSDWFWRWRHRCMIDVR